MKIAIMQPYVFPYIGYFQMIHAVDKFVFYDDVHFIKKGWINRNNILVNGEAASFSIPLQGISQNKLIKEIALDTNEKWFRQFETTLIYNYKKAPHFNKVMELVKATFDHRKVQEDIASLAICSVKQVANYLNIVTEFETSSGAYPATKGMEKAERLQQICRLNKAEDYINAMGGMELYSKEDFKKAGITLHFIKSENVSYKQFDKNFVPWLSILDVLMFNSVEEVRKMLGAYQLI